MRRSKQSPLQLDLGRFSLFIELVYLTDSFNRSLLGLISGRISGWLGQAMKISNTGNDGWTLVTLTATLGRGAQISWDVSTYKRPHHHEVI